MRNHGAFVCLPILLTLGACGSSDSGSTFENDYVRLIPEAFDPFINHSQMSTLPGPVGTVKALDHDGDGDPDLVVTGWWFWGDDATQTQTSPSRSVINLFTNDYDDLGVFNNDTSKLGGADLDAFVRRIKIRDINSDGVDDILLVANREDGRSTATPANVSASNILYISGSQGTAYTKAAVGEPAWSHDGDIADIDDDTSPEFIDASYYNDGDPGNPTRIYDITDFITPTLSDTTASVTSATYFNANLMNVSDFSGDGCPDLITVSNGSSFPDGITLKYYQNDCHAVFTQQGSDILPSGYSSTMPVSGETWTGNATTWDVIDIGGTWYAGFSVFWGEAADFDGDGDLDFLYAMDSFKVPADEQSNNYIIEGNGPTNTRLFLLKNNGSGFDLVADPVANYPSEVQLYWSHIADLNGDSCPDLVVDGYTNTSVNDSIFINDCDDSGNFSKNTVQLVSSELASNYKNMTPMDVNGDGIMDYVLRNLSLTDAPLQLLIGKQHLQP
jgi:hypothetical protein